MLKTAHAWQDHSSQSMFYVLFPLQRNQTGPQSHVLQFCPFCRETRKDHSPTFNSSAPSAEKPDRTTVPCTAVLPPLQRNQKRPQSHVQQFCPLCRETRQNHSPHSMFYSSALRQDHSPMFCSSAPSAEKPRTTVPRSTVLPPLRRNQGPQSHVQQFCPLCRETRRQHWSHGAKLQDQPWGNKETFAKTTAAILTTGTDLLRQNHAPTQEEEKEEITFITPALYLHIPL